MQATLIYNPNSGGTGAIPPEELLQALREAGYEPRYEATETEEELDALLAGVEGLVVTAGGDGTVHAVGKRLVNKKVPLLPLPLGTANNIATSLGLEGDPLELIAGLARPRRHYFDVGLVHFPWGQEYFLEAMGYGFYADTLATYEPERGKSVLRGLTALTETLSAQRSYACPLFLDGRDISGEYVMVEVLNTPSFGPWLKMAPNADLEDGLLEVIAISHQDRDSLLDYVGGILNESIDQLSSVSRQRGRVLEFTWTGFALHVDGEVRPDWIRSQPEGAAATDPAPIRVELRPRALEFWLPGLGNHNE